MKWIKAGDTAPISIYVDNSIMKPINPNTKNYGWLAESRPLITHFMIGVLTMWNI
jgi:hypothetical protein